MRKNTLPKLPELAYFVIELDLNKLPSPKGLAELLPIKKSSDNADDYYAQYQPLIEEEVIAVLKTQLDIEIKKTDYMVELTGHDDISYYPYEDMSLIKLYGENRIDCAKEMSSTRFIIAAIHLPRGGMKIAIIDIFNDTEKNQKETRLVIKGRFEEFFPNEQPFKVTPLASLVNLDRMYSICDAKPTSPLLTLIQEARVTAWPTVSTTTTSTTPSLLNENQLKAVEDFTTAKEGLFLLQGPPGTGKTTTIVAMLQKQMKLKKRTLVCAPSNKAIQVISIRAAKEIPYEPIGFIGVDSRVPDELSEISITNWHNKYPKQIADLLTQLDITHYLMGADIEKHVFHSQTKTLNLQLLDRYIQQTQQRIDKIKLLVKPCLRYLSFPSVVAKETLKNKIEAELSSYMNILTKLRQVDLSHQFPSLQDALHKNTQEKEEIDLFPITEKARLDAQKQYQIIQQLINNNLIACLPRTEGELLEKVTVLLCTLSISGRPSLYRPTSKTPFDTVIVDEAGQSVEAETLIPFGIAKEAKKAILVGDPRQLPATTIARSSQETNFEWSMFWRLAEENKQPVLPLTVQYRMRGHINHFPSSRYYEGRLVGDDSIRHRERHAPHFISELGVDHWINIKGREESAERSYINRTEAIAIRDTIAAIRKHDKKSSIGVITFYKGQAMLISKLLANGQLTLGTTVSTVDGFQGDEKDYVLLSFVRANDQRKIGFLGDFRRLNVAITRAKDVRLCFGDVTTFMKGSSHTEVKELIQFYEKANHIITQDTLLTKLSAQKNTAQVNSTTKPLPQVKPIGDVTTHSSFTRVKGGNPPKKFSANKTISIDKIYSSDELFNQAKLLHENLQYERAIERCQSALEKSSQQAEIYRLMAACYEGMAQNDSAETYRIIAKEFDQESLSQINTASNKIKIPLPAVKIEDFTGRNPAPNRKKIKEKIAAARALSDKNQFIDAEKAYREVLLLDELNSEIFLGLGWTLHKQKKHEAARKEFERSLKINETPLAYRGLIQSHFYLKDYEKAMDLIYECIDQFPWAKNIHELKVRYEKIIPSKNHYHLSNNNNTKLTFFSTLTTQTPNQSVSIFPPENNTIISTASTSLFPSIGNSTSTSPTKAKPSKKNLKPVTWAEISKLRELTLKGDNYDEAVKKYRKLLERDANNCELLSGLGWSLYHLKEYDDAILSFSDSLEKRKNISTYHGLALTYFKLGELSQATEVIEECLSIFTNKSKGNLVKIHELQARLNAMQSKRNGHTA